MALFHIFLISFSCVHCCHSKKETSFEPLTTFVLEVFLWWISSALCILQNQQNFQLQISSWRMETLGEMRMLKHNNCFEVIHHQAPSTCFFFTTSDIRQDFLFFITKPFVLSFLIWSANLWINALCIVSNRKTRRSLSYSEKINCLK